MTESQLQAKIIKYLEAQGWYVIKVVSSNRRGVPDLVCTKESEYYFFEIKTPTGKAQPIQIAQINTINKIASSERAFIVRSIEDVAQIIF